MKRVFLVILVVIFSATLYLYSCGKDQKSQLEKISLLLDWKAGAEHAFVYYGKDIGYFEDEGIDLEIIQGKGSSDSVAQVNGKAVDFALCAGETALLAASAEKPRPIVMIACFYWTTPTEIFSLKEKGIVKAEDLYGKNLGVVKGSSGYRNYVAYAKMIGLDTSRIKEVASSGDLRELTSQNAEVDAMVQFFYQEPLQLKLNGYVLNEIRFSEAGVQVYGQGLITRQDRLREKASSDLCKRMAKAIQKSWQATILEPKKSVDAMLKLNLGPDPVYSYAKIDEVTDFVKDGMAKANVMVIGEQTEKGWIGTYNYLKEQNMIHNDIDLKTMWTNDFLDKSITITNKP